MRRCLSFLNERRQHARALQRSIIDRSASALSAEASRRSFFSLNRVFLLAISISVPGACAAPSPAQQHNAAQPKLSPRERLIKAEQALQTAPDDQEAQRRWDYAETLRQYTLKSGTRLMLNDALDQVEKGNLQEADHTLSSALSLESGNALLLRQRAAVRLLGDDPTGAVQDIGESLQTDPDDPTSWLLLAKAQEALHHNDLSLHAFEEAIKCAPRFPHKDEQLTHYRQLAHGKSD
ncbi:hypothetical protein GS501_08420 [Saccharibacter sp. 17.LH.SD]|uniref:hypothetical protein n=1 Tax=Saccharibacter sp. 17.LH.SD TaxID=2689393 RepID=UPI00136D0024|nr:hypothetical protein [Saccharibacter sp. 17.LH.SD]MXV45062.1 hypothetical protein [Saccharibacter sp. 17.LH.SD]